MHDAAVSPRERVDFLVLHGHVLTFDDDDRRFHDGAVAIRGNRIVAVGPSSDVEARVVADRTVDASGQVVVPGLIDTYTHAGHGLARGLFDPRQGMGFGEMYWHATTPAWWFAEARLAALERIRFGVTTAVAIVGGTPPRVDEPVYALEVARANEEAGVRAIVGVGPPDPVFPHLPEPWRATRIASSGSTEVRFGYADALQVALEVISDIGGDVDGRIGACLAPPYLFGRHVQHRRVAHRLPGADDAPGIARRAEELREHATHLRVRLHTHMFRGSVSYAVRHFGRDMVCDVLGSDVVVAHANGLQPDEVEILGDRRCGIATVPVTHENVWYGYAPMIALHDAGAVVTVTTDGAAPYCSLDLLATLSPATWNQWMAQDDQSVLPSERALRAVTIDAARALGLESQVGSLEPGKKADVITVDVRAPQLTPMQSVAFQLVHHGSGSDVRTVFVDGRMLKDGAHVFSVDQEEVLAAAEREATLAVERWRGPGYSPKTNP